MSHTRDFAKATAKLDRMKQHDPAKYKRKEKALKKQLRRLNLID